MAPVESPITPRSERVDLILNQLDQLPTLPAIAARLLQVISNEESSAHDVVELIESDQALATKVLAMAGKASLAARSVDTVDKAVVLLGFDAIRHAVLSIKVYEVFAETQPSKHPRQFDRREFWKHALAVACAAHLIAERWPGHIDPEVAFVCGLLHDIGKIALDVCLPKSYDRVIQVAHIRNIPIADAELELLGLDHTVAGKRLAQRWNLPASIVETVWLHHHSPDMLPDSVTNPDLVIIVHLANIWIREQRLAHIGATISDTATRSIATQIGMPQEHLENAAPLLLDMIRQRADLLGLNDLTPGKMFVEAVSGVNLELGRLNEALMTANKELASRSQYMACIGELQRKLNTRMTLHDICQLAAGTLRSLWSLDTVLVFSRQPQGKIIYLGLEDGRGRLSEVLCLEEVPAAAQEWDALSRKANLIMAPPSTALIREKLADRLGAAPHWMIPLAKEGHTWGGVLFPAQPAQAEQLNSEIQEAETFCEVLSNALINGHERLRAERLNEGLAQVNRQLKAAQAELLQARSLGMVAEMAAGAAHELNNPLAVIVGRAELMADAAADEKIRKDLKIIREQAQRCSDIVSELMSFAKPDPPQKNKVNLPELLRQLAQQWLAKSSLTPAQLEQTISDEPLLIEADSQQLQRAFEELIKNAFEASSSSTMHLSINCRRLATDERVGVTIEDRGRGMTPEILEKARDPFFSHRPAGRGRGLGLSRAVRWLQINGGQLRLESQPQVGTKVHIEFPLSH
ncbi:MAG: Sensor histidine kinase RcsC [Phycisphaerae bacterium]|nr:Sensor histidine kinase RcsC [Phycisphaerae bacterium]